MATMEMAMTLFDLQVSADAKLAGRFNAWADALEPKIENLRRPMTQNPTPKRNMQYQSRMHDARNLERLQKALRALADGYVDGTVPALLSDLKTKDAIGARVKKYLDGSRGGYYSVIEAADYHDKSEAGRLLQSMINGSTAQQAARVKAARIGELEAAIYLSNIPSYFPTPAPVVAQMIKAARIWPDMTILEPSAGSGNIADAIFAEEPSVKIDVIEINSRLQELLKLKGYNLIDSDFAEAAIAPESYDRILMNPPFERQQDIDHVRKAYGLVKTGGVLVSIMGPSWEFRSDRKSVEFREWLSTKDATWENLPEGSFKASGTGVGTRLVVIHK
jgi:hypothetical protein